MGKAGSLPDAPRPHPFEGMAHLRDASAGDHPLDGLARDLGDRVEVGVVVQHGHTPADRGGSSQQVGHARDTDAPVPLEPARAVEHLQVDQRASRDQGGLYEGDQARRDRGVARRARTASENGKQDPRQPESGGR